jgi:hypothetical protein
MRNAPQISHEYSKKLKNVDGISILVYAMKLGGFL